MIEKGYESRVKIQDIIETHLPEFILDESPKAIEFLRQYYISQEYQGGSIDIAENLDEYLKVDNFTPEVIVGFTSITSGISTTSSVISVESTKGFPKKYGLLKIDNEIITYTGLTTNTFTGCIRGFSGISSHYEEGNVDELVFSTSTATSHSANAPVENLSVLFLKEFYKKIKYSLTPGFEDLNFVPELNVGNFIKEARTFYETKGTDESFRILFNVLFGETPKIIDLEKFIIKPSAATYMRREVVVADVISGNPLKLIGQTVKKKTDDKTSASVSEVEVISRKGKVYYKLLLFIGYDDSFPTITGEFNITGSSKVLEDVAIGDSVISVDSTIGFPESGKVYYEIDGEEVQISYTSKSVNQFFGCSGITVEIPTASRIRSDEIYYGYEDGDTSKIVELRFTGVLSNYKSEIENSFIKENEKITIKSLGELIRNPVTNPSYKEIFANSWIYNTSCRFKISSFTPNIPISQFIIKGVIDKSSLKEGDYIDILARNSQVLHVSNLKVISITGNQITTDQSFTLSSSFDYDIRRKIKYARSTNVSLEYDPIIADVQNVYDENSEYMYVASNSLPSYNITKSTFSYNVSALNSQDQLTLLYSQIVFSSPTSFFTGNEVYYSYSSTPISGLSEGLYYVQVISSTTIRLYTSRTALQTGNYLKFEGLPSGTHTFTLSSQKERLLSPQKILRKFPLSVNIGDGKSNLTENGSVGLLINGVEISSYKSNRKVYYGPLKSVKVLSKGNNYDVINPPVLELSSGSALVQPILSGSVQRVDVLPQDFDINQIVTVSVVGGNGKGASLQPVVEVRRREIEFDARVVTDGGGIDIDNEIIYFKTKHGLADGQAITYRSGNNAQLEIGDFDGINVSTGRSLISESTYYAKYVTDNSIRLYQTKNDYIVGINTIGFVSAGNSGIHKFVTERRKTLRDIKVIEPGSGYQNRKLIVNPVGISTVENTVSFVNHGFKTGEIVTYNYQTSSISGLSSSNQYYVVRLDKDTFNLCDAGIGGTFVSDYERNKVVNFESSGTGYQYFSYPPIEINVDYSTVGIGSTQFKGSISATPVVRGKIIGVYVYEEGSDYGSTIIDYHKKPNIYIRNGKEAALKPIIVNGKIENVSIQYGGSEYYSTPDIRVYGSGTGAVLRPVIDDGRIVAVTIVNKGSGYSAEDTTLIVDPAGIGAILDPQVRSLEINNNILFKDKNDTSAITNEIIRSSYDNLQYTISGYSDIVQNEFGDDGTRHSPIIGWAYDGNPIYGSWGYADPKNINSGIKRLVPGYVFDINNVENRPIDFGTSEFFVEDYTFTNSGDLDEYNGRFCFTPEFPNGVYAYFATSIVDGENNVIGSFPYFIGDRYRSRFIKQNKTLNQSFDFNNSDLIRNTFPYKIADRDCDNDFITESNEIINQQSVVKSVTTGSVTGFEIVDGGDNYTVGDRIKFDESNNKGGGLVCEVFETTNSKITNLQTSIDSYDDSIFVWKGTKKVGVIISPNHDLRNLDNVSISGFSTDLSVLNGFYKIGVSSFSSSLLEDVPDYSTTGNIADIYVSANPSDVSIGSTITIDDETFSILNVFPKDSVLRVSRPLTGVAHTAGAIVKFVPDKFTFNLEKPLDYFESAPNDLVYFNPNQSVGVGTTSGISIQVTYPIGYYDYKISIPTQSIYLPNHPFRTNQKVIIRKPGSASPIVASKNSNDSGFDLFNGGNSKTVFIIKKSRDYIGIVTQVGLTSTTNGLFFLNNGTDDFKYSLESNYSQIVKGDVKRIKTKVTTSTQHGLNEGDKINLVVEPNLSVGIGTSTSVSVKYDPVRNRLLINQISFSSSKISVSSNKITLVNHRLKTGQKILYTATTPAVGLSNGYYYVYKVDEDSIKLCETFKDSTSSPPRVVDITSAPSSTHKISQINPPISVIRNNNIVFNLSDSSLYGYNFKVFYDRDFKDEFVSSGINTVFSVSGVGTVGLTSTAAFTIDFDESVPPTLYYTLEKSGYISTADTDVENYSQINLINSFYNNSYEISGVTTTTFDISLPVVPESDSYSKYQCDVLKYTTNSSSSYGSISKIRIISPGFGFDKLPLFTGTDSPTGYGAYVIPTSEKIGKINQIRILNEGFEYPSDKTLKPEAAISKLITIKNSNEILSIKVSDGGKNYTTAPDLIVVNPYDGQIIDSGVLGADLDGGSSIKSVIIYTRPKGLPERTVRIVATNNTNGIKVEKVEISLSGTILCTLVTPLSGFGVEPFAIGDKIFVEGIQKDGIGGSGFNSADYGYEFFTVIDYLNGGTSSKRILEFSLLDYTANPGIPNNIENSYGTIVNYSNYPKFSVTQVFSDFIIGESVQFNDGTGFVLEDHRVVETNKNFIKLSGIIELRVGYIIRGVESSSIATITDIKESKGYFNISYSSPQRLGWSDNIGMLNDDIQVIEDNDYYQNLSYAIKSTKGWEEIVSPVNNLVHPSGLKNFADKDIIGKGQFYPGDQGPNGNSDSTFLYDILETIRVDTINNFDLTKDVNIDEINNYSKFLQFKNKKLVDYIECKTNRVLEIDDISQEFSTFFGRIDFIPFKKVTSINSTQKYGRYLIQITNKDYSKVQFVELIILNSPDYDIFTLERGSISSDFERETGYGSNKFGSFSGYVDEDDNLYLRFDPTDPYNDSFNIKYLTSSFTNSSTGIGSTSVGFVGLSGVTTTVNPALSTNLVTVNSSKTKSIHSQINIIDNATNEMNYVEVFVDHDGTNTNLSELYFDTENTLSSNFIGLFNSSLSGGNLILSYTNNSSNSVTIKTRNVGFGTTQAGIGTYSFKASGQTSGTERTVKYESKYANVSSASTIASFSSSSTTSIKSTIRVGFGSTSALHQVMTIKDAGNNTYTMQYPFVSIGSTLGIGTFGASVSNSTLSLVFYPDKSGTFEILSFNESFHSKTDFLNIPQTLTYGTAFDTVSVSNYIGINDPEINKLNFDLNYNQTPIFMKTFDPSDSNVLNLSTGNFNIQNHFFSTGEEMIYRANTNFDDGLIQDVGIGQTLNYLGVSTNILPPKVYAIKIDNNNFKLATRKEYALSGIAVTFTSIGYGNAHELEMFEKNSKAIIAIDNIVQSPIAYKKLNFTVDNGGSIGASSSIFGLSGISSIVVGDILKIDDEYMQVVSVGVGTTYSGPVSFDGTLPLVKVRRGSVGSAATTHLNSTAVKVYSGSYNIVKNEVFFTGPPVGDLSDEIIGDTDNLSEARSSFNGRVFLRSNYDTNKVFDDVSNSFTGVGKTFTLSVGGINTVGLGSSGENGIVLINGFFQSPKTENNDNYFNFSVIENATAGISSIVFSGIRDINDESFISESDVNTSQLPRGGIIVSLGATNVGRGYAPLVGASVTARVTSGAITSIGIGTTGSWGSGYRAPVVVDVYEKGHTGNDAIISANVGLGGTLSFSVVSGGSGYTNPTINVSPPSYSNLPVVGVSRLSIGPTTQTGTGLLLNVEVGASSTTGIGSTLFEVTGFEIARNGFGFRVGDVFSPVGLVTQRGLAKPSSNFNLTVLDTFSDSFSSWQFGQIDYIDSIKNYQNGIRKRFPLYYRTQLLSFQTDNSNSDSQLIDLNSLLIIFINGIIQEPGVSYEFGGGSSFVFNEAPQKDDEVEIFFYRGSKGDSEIVEVFETIKEGDDVRVYSNNNYLETTITQDKRTLTDIKTSDVVETDLYTNEGIDSNTYKPLYWTKQKVDKIIDGKSISKARDSIETQAYPTARIIGNVSSTDTELFVDNARFFDYEDPSYINFDALIIPNQNDPVAAGLTAVVSAAGTIQSIIINNPGSGYISTEITVTITSPAPIPPSLTLNETGYYVTMPTGDFINYDGNGYEVTIVKFDLDWNIKWQKLLTQPTLDHYLSWGIYTGDICVDKIDQSLYFVGHSEYPIGPYDTMMEGLVIKFGSDGDVKWKLRYMGDGDGFYDPSWCNMYTVENSKNNGYIYVGGRLVYYDYDTDQTSLYQTITKISVVYGYTQWTMGLRSDFYSYSGSPGIVAIGIDSNDNIYGTGSSYFTLDPGWSNNPLFGLVIKCDSSGILTWQRRIGDPDDKFIRHQMKGLAVDSDDNVYVYGNIQTLNQYYSILTENPFLIKFDSDGNVLFQKQFDQNVYPIPPYNPDSFGYAIDSSYVGNGSQINISNGLLILSGAGRFEYPKEAVLIKIPLDKLETSNGTYGNIVISDISLIVSTSTYETNFIYPYYIYTDYYTYVQNGDMYEYSGDRDDPAPLTYDRQRYYSDLDTTKWVVEYGATNSDNPFYDATRFFNCQFDGTDKNDIYATGEGSGINYAGQLVKFSSSGNLLWYKRFTKSMVTFGDYGVSLGPIAKILGSLERNFYTTILSSSTTPDLSGYQTVIVKFDANANIIWEKTVYELDSISSYGSNGFISQGLSFDENNDRLYLVGQSSRKISQSPLVFKYDGEVVKLYSSGNIVWKKRFTTNTQVTCDSYGSPINVLWTEIHGSTLNNSGDLYINGISITLDGSNIPYRYQFASKLDKNTGNVVWIKGLKTDCHSFTLPFTDLFGSTSSIKSDYDDNLYTLGNSFFRLSPSWSKTDPLLGFIVKYDSDGNLIWQKIIGNPLESGPPPDSFNRNKVRKLFIDSQNNIYVYGIKETALVGNPTATQIPFLIKLDSNGNVLFQKQFTQNVYSIPPVNSSYGVLLPSDYTSNLSYQIEKDIIDISEENLLLTCVAGYRKIDDPYGGSEKAVLIKIPLDKLETSNGTYGNLIISDGSIPVATSSYDVETITTITVQNDSYLDIQDSPEQIIDYSGEYDDPNRTFANRKYYSDADTSKWISEYGIENVYDTYFDSIHFYSIKFDRNTTPENNIYAAGIHSPYDDDNLIYTLLTKFDKQGNLLWTRRFIRNTVAYPYNNSYHLLGSITMGEVAAPQQVTQQRDLYVLSTCYADVYSGDTTTIIKFDPYGNIKWQRDLVTQYASAGALWWGVALGQLHYSKNTDHLYYVGINQHNLIPDFTTDVSQDGLLIKLDSDGNEVWVKSFSGDISTQSNPDIKVCAFCTLAMDNDENLYTGGYVTKSDGSNVFWYEIISKIDKDTGNPIWIKGLKTNYYSTSWYTKTRILSIKTDLDNNIYALGNFAFSLDNNPHPFNGHILKLDSDGNIIWQKVIGDPNPDYISPVPEYTMSDLFVDWQNNLYVYGQVYTDLPYPTSDTIYPFLIKFDSDGNVLYQKRFSLSYSPSNPYFDGYTIDNPFSYGWYTVKTPKKSIDIQNGNLILYGNSLNRLPDKGAIFKIPLDKVETSDGTYGTVVIAGISSIPVSNSSYVLDPLSITSNADPKIDIQQGSLVDYSVYYPSDTLKFGSNKYRSTSDPDQVNLLIEYGAINGYYDGQRTSFFDCKFDESVQNNIYAAGTVGGGSLDYYTLNGGGHLVKFDQNGNVLWYRRLVRDSNYFYYYSRYKNVFLSSIVIGGIYVPEGQTTTATYTGIPLNIGLPPCNDNCTNTARAVGVASIVNGVVSYPIIIANPGCGYTYTNPPQILATSQENPIYDNIKDVKSVQGFSGNIVGIQTFSSDRIAFYLDPNLSPFPELKIGNPIYVFNTRIGNGVTSVAYNSSQVIGIGTTFLDNVYQIYAVVSNSIILCKIQNNPNLSGISTSGNSVGNFSWGKLSGFTRSSSPISIGVAGNNIDSDLSSFPIIQRRGYGLRNIGPVKKSNVDYELVGSSGGSLESRPIYQPSAPNAEVSYQLTAEPTPPPVVSNPGALAEYFVVTYEFTDGSDLDTRTSVLGPIVSGGPVGWCKDNTIGSPVYITWGGDNRGTGVESVLIDIAKYKLNAPTATTIKLRFAAFWYSTKGNNPVTIKITSYIGGAMIQSGFTWINPTATEVYNNFTSFSKIVNTNINSCVNGEQVVDLEINFGNGTVTYS